MFEKLFSPEFILVAIILLLLFGGKKLPELTRGLIHSIKEFRTAYQEGIDEAEKDDDDKK